MMAKRRFWAYRVEVWCAATFFTPGQWHTGQRGGKSGDGRPTAENLDRWVQQFEAALGEKPYKRFRFGPVVRARVIHQETDVVVAEWRRAGAGFVRLTRHL